MCVRELLGRSPRADRGVVPTMLGADTRASRILATYKSPALFGSGSPCTLAPMTPPRPPMNLALFRFLRLDPSGSLHRRNIVVQEFVEPLRPVQPIVPSLQLGLQ